MPDEEPQRSGWLPPRPPSLGADAPPSLWARPSSGTSSSPPDAGRPPLGPPGGYRAVERPPSSPAAVVGIVVGILALLLLLLTAGTAYLLSGILGLSALMFGRAAQRKAATGGPGRPGQIRAAMLLGGGVLALALIAAVAWFILSENGITQMDLRDALERQRDRLQAR